MGRLNPKPKVQLNIKRIVIIGSVVGVSVSTVLFIIFGTGGTIISTNTSHAAPPPTNGGGIYASSVPKGPGGVGTTDGSSSLKIWYRTDNGMSVSSGEINAWENSAGVPELDLVQTAGNKPSVVTNAINGHSEVSFTSNAHWLKTAQGSLDTSNFVTDEASTFVVNKADVTNQASCLYTTDPLVGNSRFTNHIPWGGKVYYDIGTCCSQNARIQINNVTGVTNYNIWTYDAKQSTGKQLYQNGTLLQSRPNVTTYFSHSTQRFRIGRNYKGDVTEVIIFNRKINTTERYIVDNYLSSKYDIDLNTHDLFAHDNGPGGYDFDMAGIGKVSSTDYHDDSQGTGFLRIRNAQDLDNGEFLFWAHDNASSAITSINDIPTGVDYRMVRTWKVTEADINENPVDVGAIDMFFDLEGLGTIDSSQVRLIVDTDSDGSFADETPIDGATNPTGDVFGFIGIQEIVDNASFTIGLQTAPSLPIELGTFDVKLIDDEYVSIEWMTVTERNNDYFTIERLTDGSDFEEIGTVEGAGSSLHERHYSFKDFDLFNGTAYYRLRQTDYDGATEVFDPKSVSYQLAGEPMEINSFGPNPFSDNFSVEFTVAQSGPVQFTIHNLQGTRVYSKEISAEKGKSSVTYSEGYKLTSGVYLVSITNSKGEKVSEKIIKR